MRVPCAVAVCYASAYVIANPEKVLALAPVVDSQQEFFFII